MKNNLLKIIPFALLLALFFEILGYLKIDFPADISLFLASFNSICFSISIPLLVFCCLSKKSESLSNCGIFLVFLYVFLNILSCELKLSSSDFFFDSFSFIIFLKE